MLNKVLLSGLFVFSLCSADISGIVTDTSGTIPLSGAVVKLEKSGRVVTTAADGRFTLVSNTAILLGPTNQRSKSTLAAAIRNGLLYINVVEKSSVEITILNLSGKALCAMRKYLDAGIYSFSIPQGGTSVYLYKVKSGSNELLLKGNSIEGAAAVLVQGSMSYRTLAKQAKATTAIDDVIQVTKNGYLNYRVVIKNSDTAALAIKMIASSGTLTDADGNVYQTVKLGNQEWTVENLRTTTYRDGSAIPFDTSMATWADTTPKFCYYGNTTNADSIMRLGALYNWYVIDSTNPKKIAPVGWHVPLNAEWDTLENYLKANGYNLDGTAAGNMIAKSMASKADWDTSSTQWAVGNKLTENNTSGFSALPGGERNYNGVFCNIGSFGYWLSSTKIDEMSAYSRDLSNDWGYVYNDYGNKSCGFSLRLIRDH
jgi:uncharacterized protein (TIGR02145 family)